MIGFRPPANCRPFPRGKAGLWRSRGGGKQSGYYGRGKGGDDGDLSAYSDDEPQAGEGGKGDEQYDNYKGGKGGSYNGGKGYRRSPYGPWGGKGYRRSPYGPWGSKGSQYGPRGPGGGKGKGKAAAGAPNPYSDDERPAAAASGGGLRFGPCPDDERPAAAARAAHYSADGRQGEHGRGGGLHRGLYSDDEPSAAAARDAPNSADGGKGAPGRGGGLRRSPCSDDDEAGGAGVVGESELTRKQLRDIVAVFADAPLEEMENKLTTWQEALDAGTKNVVTAKAVKKLLDSVPECAMQLAGFAEAEATCGARARLKGAKPAQVVAALAAEVKKLRRVVGEAAEGAWEPAESLEHAEEA